MCENACVSLHRNTRKFKVTRGVRQGDTIFLKLFTPLLEFMSKNINFDLTMHASRELILRINLSKHQYMTNPVMYWWAANRKQQIFL